MSVGARAGSVTLHPGLWGSIHFYDYIAVLVLSDTLIFAVYWNGIQVVMIDFEKENDWRASVLSYRRLFIIRNLDSMFCHWRWFLLDNQIRFDNMALALFLLWNKTDDILLQKKKNWSFPAKQDCLPVDFTILVSCVTMSMWLIPWCDSNSPLSQNVP